MSDKFREFIDVPQQFVRDGNQVRSLLNFWTANCSSPHPSFLHVARNLHKRVRYLSFSCPQLLTLKITEFTQICKAVAVGFAVMGFIGYFVKLIHIPMCVMTSTYPFLCPHITFQKQYSCVRPILYDHSCSLNNRLSPQRWSLIFCRVPVINNLLIMDHLHQADSVCHIQTKRGPLSHRVVESISVLTESGLRNTGMLSRERLSSDLRFFFQKYQTRKISWRERLAHNTGYNTTFCVPQTTAAANGTMLQSAKSSHECYETTDELPVSLQAMQRNYLPEGKFWLCRLDVTISSNYDL